MKKTTAILLFLCCNALLVFFEVHKQGQYLTLSYELQKLQSKISVLSKQHSDLMYTLHALQQPNTIQNHVQKSLSMKPMELKNIKKISEQTQTMVTS